MPHCKHVSVPQQLSHAVASAGTEAAASLEDAAQQPAAEQAASAGVFFDFPETGGASLPPRWCHAAASMGERLYVYGGIGQGLQQLSDIHFFSISEGLL